MATLTATPDNVLRSREVSFVGEGFAADSVVTIEVDRLHVASEIVTDANGDFGSDDVADSAFALLTSDATNVVEDEAVTIGAVTYTFKDAVTTVANTVKVGADAAASLVNLKHAINLTGTPGTHYGSETVIHPTVTATTITATTLRLVAKVGGTAGNSLASTETSAHLSFGGTTFAGGSAATGVSSLIIRPEVPGLYTATATDGANTATATVRVWTS